MIRLSKKEITYSQKTEKSYIKLGKLSRTKVPKTWKTLACGSTFFFPAIKSHFKYNNILEF